MIELEGSCHCGNLRVRLHSTRAAGELPLRACDCTFCRKHGARTTADPEGHLEVKVAEAGELSRYQFGLKTGEFLVCRRCGTYVAATMREGGSWLAVLNVNLLADQSPFARPAESISYDGETSEQRIARRKQRWMPCEMK